MPTAQLLDVNGKLVAGATLDKYQDEIDALDDDLLLEFYRRMITMRSLDTQASALQRQGQLAMWVPSVGQEAAQVGSALAMHQQDWLFPSYREHVMTTIRGVPFQNIISMFRGNTHGVWDWQGTRCHQYTLVIGAQSLHAAGFAMALDRDGVVGTGNPETDTAVLACFGDGATSEGDVSEAFVFSASTNAPVVFLCQNNGWAISVPTSTQMRRPIAERAAGFGLRTNRIDGNDVLLSYLTMRDQLDTARAGGGPGLVEAMTYRMGAHTSSDDPTKYRLAEDEQAWAPRDPITRYRAYLLERGATADSIADVDAAAQDTAADLRNWITTLPEPTTADMFDYVYTEPHPTLEAERAWVESYETQMGGE